MRKQLSLGIERSPELDRNHALGGRSFYFFDFDDNIAVLSTPILIFHKEHGRALRLTSREFGEHSGDIGERGIFKDYRVILDDQIGSFQYFRDKNQSWLERLLKRKQVFEMDLLHALGLPEHHWQGPSWNCFYHAVYNKRPISLITARGHHPETLKNGIKQLVTERHIPHEPNYLGLFPVNHPETKLKLGKSLQTSVAEMKQAAIRSSVEIAFTKYGFSEHHRFGMSDDDPHNVELIIEEMSKLKKKYPKNSFFVFDTQKGQFVRREVFADYTQDRLVGKHEGQLNLF